MDFTLRCNSLKCRAQLNDRAVVTTCSHIFCISCSEALGLSTSAAGVRVCPACETQLVNTDDVVVTQVNPTEDYKTSVLSGLNPGIIMECTTRGMAFFQYQTTQEIMYQDYMARSLTDKYATLSSQMDSVINDANAEIMSLRDKLSALHTDKKTLEQKNQELSTQFQERCKALHRIQTLYQKLKGKQNAAHIENAAANDAENVVQSIDGSGFMNNIYGDGVPQRPTAAHVRGPDMPLPYAHARMGSAGTNGSGKRQASTSRPYVSQLPRRTENPDHPPAIRPPRVVHSGRSSAYVYPDNCYHATGDDAFQATPHRQPLGPGNLNMTNSHTFGSYGLSGGVKAGGTAAEPFIRASSSFPSNLPTGRGIPHITRR